MSSSSKPEGPWEPLVLVIGIPGWEDPSPFWDENGTGYWECRQFFSFGKLYSLQ